MKTYWRILSYIRPYGGQVASHAVFTVLAVLFSGVSFTLLQPLLKLLFLQEGVAVVPPPAEFSFDVQYMLDWLNYYVAQLMVENTKMQALLFIVALVVGMNLLGNVFNYFSTFFVNRIRTGVVADLREELFGKLTTLQLAYVEGERKGDLMTRLTSDVKELEQSVVVSFQSLFRDPFTILFYLVVMIMFSWQLTLFILVLLPVSAVVIAKITRSLRKDATTSQGIFSHMMSVIEETISGIRIIKAFNGEAFVRRIFNRYNEEYKHLHQRQHNRSTMAGPVSEILGVTTVGFILWYGGSLVFKGQLDASGFIVFILIFSQILKPAKGLSNALSNVNKGIASGDRLFSLADTPITIFDKPDARPISDFRHSICFEGVSFSYVEGEPVLRNIELELKKGSITALVGPSGCGKTTLAELIPRFYDPTHGRVTIDGTDLRDLQVRELRSLIAIVTQDPILFNASIYQNIAFGMADVQEEDVIAAARSANAHEFIMELPQGYQTNVGDRGGLLSGGQRQRISIARALLKNPPILILDEATSALDTASEKIVQDALFRLMQHRTSLIIAHRLSTIQEADRILVMERGRIISQGTHEELVNTAGLYKELYVHQSL